MIKKLSRGEDGMFFTDYEMSLSKRGTPWVEYAPFYITESFLSRDQVDDVIRITSKYDNELIKGGVVGVDNTKIDDYRNTTIAFLRNQEDKEYQFYDDLIIRKTEQVNQNVFNLNLTSVMEPQYTVYGPGMFFNWHPDGPFGLMDKRGMDCVPENLHWRKLTTVVMLSDHDEYQDGHLEFVITSMNPERCVSSIRLGKGDAVTFPAFLAHRVTPIKLGLRKTLVYWFCGPRWR